VGKFVLPLVALAGWAWGVYAWRRLRRTRRSLGVVEADKREAERVGSNRSRFITYLAHETRTLLYALHGGLRMVRRGTSKYPPSHLLGLIEAMTIELQALTSLTLDRGHIDSGKFEPDLAAVNLQSLAEQVVEEFKFMAEASGLLLITAAPEETRLAWTDAVRLRQVLRNLVSNGLKWTRKGSVTVFIQSDLKKQMLALQVIDTGVGLSAQQGEQLFSDYAQPNGAGEIGGTGLGLSIARNISRALGGDLTFVSTPGLGSTFTVWVPEAVVE
jgi:signal transduction histidine kinase